MPKVLIKMKSYKKIEEVEKEIEIERKKKLPLCLIKSSGLIRFDFGILFCFHIIIEHNFQ